LADIAFFALLSFPCGFLARDRAAFFAAGEKDGEMKRMSWELCE
jgi:hypothetical protein